MYISTSTVGAFAFGVMVAAGSGCASGQRGDDPRRAVAPPRAVGWYLKKVVAKESPDLLMANDATFCRVPVSQFRAVTTGTSIRCNWQ